MSAAQRAVPAALLTAVVLLARDVDLPIPCLGIRVEMIQCQGHGFMPSQSTSQ